MIVQIPRIAIGPISAAVKLSSHIYQGNMVPLVFINKTATYYTTNCSQWSSCVHWHPYQQLTLCFIEQEICAANTRNKQWYSYRDWRSPKLLVSLHNLWQAFKDLPCREIFLLFHATSKPTTESWICSNHESIKVYITYRNHQILPITPIHPRKEKNCKMSCKTIRQTAVPGRWLQCSDLPSTLDGQRFDLQPVQ